MKPQPARSRTQVLDLTVALAAITFPMVFSFSPTAESTRQTVPFPTVVDVEQGEGAP